MFVAPPSNIRGPSGEPTNQGRPRVVVATDGSSLGNPGPGGWGWYVDAKRWAAGAVRDATNNQMELQAIAEALDAIPDTCDLEIQADSSYSIDALTKWIHGWKKRGWKTASGSDVANRELIEAIDGMLVRRKRAGGTVVFTHVRGHAGHALNEAVDGVARGASEALKAGVAPATGPGWSEIEGTDETQGQSTEANEMWSGQGSLFGL